MARPRKSTNVLALTGSLKSHPDRRKARENEPIPTEGLAGVAPAWMTDSQRASYEELVRRCHADVLCSADGPWLEVCSCLLASIGKRLGR